MRHVLAVVTALALPLTLTACVDAVETVEDGIAQATEQAEETVELAQFCAAALEVADAVNDGDWDRAIERGEVMVTESPDEIRSDAETVLAGAKRIRDGETQVAQDESFQSAADRVEAYTSDRCDPTS